MLVLDRVICDFCFCSMGQLYGTRVCTSQLPDMRISPHFSVCPDCLDDSEPVEVLNAVSMF